MSFGDSASGTSFTRLNGEGTGLPRRIAQAQPHAVGRHVDEDVERDARAADEQIDLARAAVDAHAVAQHLGVARVEAQHERAARERPRVGLGVVPARDFQVLRVPRVIGRLLQRRGMA
jgi:hypothetical protein